MRESQEMGERLRDSEAECAALREEKSGLRVAVSTLEAEVKEVSVSNLTEILYVPRSRVRGLVFYHRDFRLCISRHTPTQIWMLTKLNLAHRIEEYTVDNLKHWLGSSFHI